jgi:predicted MFS family arabinose efflux permease
MSAISRRFTPSVSHAIAGGGLSPALTFVFALAAGALVANLYYAQALVTVISPALGIPLGFAGSIVTVAQLGYAAGLIFIVSLADLVENRRLILICVAGTVVGLIGTMLAPSAAVFMIASAVAGICSVGAQIIVPFAATMAKDEQRGSVIGNVMGGLIAGIMLARPAANFIASAFGWRAVFGVSAAIAVVIFAVLWVWLPRRIPTSELSYGGILKSSLAMLRDHPVLRRRALYQSVIFGVFSLFWTAAPFVLTQRFGFDQRQIALFALAGAGGALSAPIAGRLADRGFTRASTLGAMLTAIVAFLIAGWAGMAGAIVILALAAIALDASAQANQIISQRIIYNLDPHARGRINAIYMTCLFIAAAGGSLLAGATYASGGWIATMLTGAALVLSVLAAFATERRTRPAGVSI